MGIRARDLQAPWNPDRTGFRKEREDMGKTRRKFEIGFKRQVVEEIESGLITKYGAARKYDISAGVIERWREKYEAGILTGKPTSEEKALKAENERLKAKVGELIMQIDILKKMEDYARQRRKEDTCVITGKNLGEFQGGAK